MADVQIKFKADSKAAQRSMSELTKEIQRMQQGLTSTADKGKILTEIAKRNAEQFGKGADAVQKATGAFGTATRAADALTGALGRGVNVIGKSAASLKALLSPSSLATTAIGTLTQAWVKIYNSFQKTQPFEEAAERLNRLNIESSETAQSFGLTSESISQYSRTTRGEIFDTIQRLDELRGQIVRLSNASGDNREALSETRGEYRELLGSLEALLGKLPSVATETAEVTVEMAEVGAQTKALSKDFLEADNSLETFSQGANTRAEQIRSLKGEISELNREIVENNLAAATADKDTRASFAEQNRYLRAEIALRRQQISELQNYRTAQDAFDDAQGEVITSTKTLTGEIITLEQAFNDLLGPFDSTNLAYNDFQSRIQSAALAVAGFTGEIEGVDEPFNRLTAATHASTAALEDEQKALDAVRKSIIQQTQDAEGLAHVYEVLERRTNAHNAALVNPVVSRAAASLRDYATELDSAEFSSRAIEEVTSDVSARITDFARQTLTAEGVIGNFAKGIDEVENRYVSLQSVSDRLINSIREQSSGFEELARSVDMVTEAEQRRQRQQGRIADPRLPGELLDFRDNFDRFDRSVRATRGNLGLLTGIFDTLSDDTEIFADVAFTAFDELSRSVLQSAEDIDTVGASLAAVSDLAARVALGDVTALVQALFRINEILQAQDAAALQNRLSRRDEAVDFRTRTGIAENNLATLARALGIPIGRLDPSEAPHTIQGLQSLNDFSGTGLDILFRNLSTGRNDIAGGLTAGIEEALEDSNLQESIARSLTVLAVNLERIITNQDIQDIFEPSVAALKEVVDQAEFNLQFARQTGGDVQGALQDSIRANTDYYQRRIDAANLERQLFGTSIENVEELNRILQATNNQTRAALTLLDQTGGEIVQRGNFRRRDAQSLAERTGTDRQFTEDIARAQYGSTAYDTEVAAAQATPDAVATQTLRSIIENINDDIALINASILSVETQIERASDPEQIAELLSRIPDLIAEKYRLLREALDERYNEAEISVDVYNASLKELASRQTGELERHSDAVLANTLRIIDEDAQLINASITALETQIDQSNDSVEIARLLDQVPALITEKYRLLRQALDEKYLAGEISVDVYNASLSQIASSQASETERHSDAVLANTLSEIDDNVALIDASIESLQFSISQSDDPEAIAGFLEAIRILIADKYRRLRERLGELLAAEEISQTAFDAAILGLTTAENRALTGIDTQALNAISAAAQERVDFINGSIENLRLSLQLTDDPAEIQSILDAIKVLTQARFDTLRDELEALRETMKPEQYQQALKGLNLAETLALENLDIEKFDAISDEAEKQVTAINTDIENLRLSLQLTDDPAERQQILDAIRILTVARFSVLREELENIKDSLDPADYNRALRGINIGEQVALSNIDTKKFDEISAEAMRQVNAINSTIENLRLSLQLTENPAETQRILDAIKILTAARFDVLIQELHDIRDSMDADDFNRALTGLELGKQVALNNIDSEKLSAISAAAKKQVGFIEGAIDNLELALQLTDDPAEIQQILASIRILTGKRFDRLIQELHDIRDSFESDAEFNQALEGLELGKQVALKGIDDRSIGVTLAGIGENIGEADSEIAQLFEELENETTLLGVTGAIARLRTAIINKHALMRQKINESAETEEEKARQIRAVNLQESKELEGLGQRGLGQLDSLVDTAQFLLDNATEAEFGTRRQNLRDAINNFYDARIAFINGLDLSETDRANMLAVADIQRNIALEAIPQMSESVRERLEMERELQDEIQDLRDQQLDAERERQEALVELEEETQEKIMDIHRKANQDREDINREFGRDVQDNFRESQEKIAELLRQEGFGGGEIRDFLSGFEGDIRSRLSDSGRLELREIEGQRLDTEVDLRRERDRDLEDVGIKEERQIEDQRLELERARVAIDAQLLQQQSQLNVKIGALTGELSGIKATETVIAAASEATTAAETAASHAMVATENVSTGIEAANTAATTLDSIVEHQRGIVEALGPVSENFVRATEFLSKTEALPRLATAVEALPYRMAAALEGVLRGGLTITNRSVSEQTGIIPVGIPVEQEADNRLFHFERTDAIANRLSRQAALSRSRSLPNYLPDANQIRNAKDLGREVVRGFTEGIAEAGRRDGGIGDTAQQAGFPEEITATVQIQFPDGTVQEIRDQIVKLEQQDR